MAMNFKMKVKIAIDIAMAVLFVFLLSYQLTGLFPHEIAGTVLVVLAAAHVCLNVRWFGAIFKGRYGAARALRTIVNVLFAVDVILLAVSGIAMSNYVFAPLGIRVGAFDAQTIHLTCAYWAFVLVGAHIGLHAQMLPRALRTIPFRILAAAAAIYGAYTFWNEELWNYMLALEHFAMFDFDESALTVVSENIAMMILWAHVSFYALKLLTPRARARSKS